jgi:DNA-binding response OmpR family regulator
VARILIAEPHADIRALLELVVRRLGHEPVVHDGGDAVPGGIDAAVIEPGGDREGLPLARSLRAAGTPVLFVSIYPPGAETAGLAPSAYLVKPFPLSELEVALALTLAPVEAPATAV